MLNKSNKYLREWLTEVKEQGILVNEPRTKWSDGTPAKYYSIKQKVAEYDISKGEFPINTLRPTAIKGGFHEIQWFYQKQTDDLSKADKSIHSWWKDFIVHRSYIYKNPSKEDIEEGIIGCDTSYLELAIAEGKQPKISNEYIGNTYGAIVSYYDLTNKLLDGLVNNPFGRRHQIDLWQYYNQGCDPRALPPCVFLNMWSVEDWGTSRKLNLTLIQRSQDALMTHSINPTQYTMLGMMICSDLRKRTGINYQMGKVLHIINDYHVYDRHYQFIDEVLSRDTELDYLQPKIELNVDKDFYDITWEDFEIVDYVKPQPLSGKLEIAI